MHETNFFLPRGQSVSKEGLAGPGKETGLLPRITPHLDPTGCAPNPRGRMRIEAWVWRAVTGHDP